MNIINVKDLLKIYCTKKKGGCKWYARRNKVLKVVRITHTKQGKPDKIEFLERDKMQSSKYKNNITYHKLIKPILIINDPKDEKRLIWYEVTHNETKVKPRKKHNKTAKQAKPQKSPTIPKAVNTSKTLKII